MPLSLEPKEVPTEHYSVAEGVMELPQRLDARAAPRLAESLLRVRGAALKLNCQSIEMVGYQSAVALVSAAKTWRQGGFCLELLHPSDPFVRDINHLGLSLEDLSVS